MCDYLRSVYGASNVVPNYKVRGLVSTFEIDFAILEEGRLRQLVEFHPMVREDDASYIERRMEMVKVLFGKVPLVVVEEVPKSVDAPHLRKISEGSS